VSRRALAQLDVDTDGWGTSRRATVVAWVLFALVALGATGVVLRADFRRHPVLGDSASYLLQAESLGFAGHDLAYDQRDLEYFRSFGWAPEPYGLYFQRNGDGWAFAKPYGYSVVLAPAIRVFGPRLGVAVANLALMAVVGALGAATLRLRYRGAIVPLVLGVFLFASPLIFYAFHIWVELFWSPLVLATLYALVRAVRDGKIGWALGGAALMAFLLSEKMPALPLVAPLFALVVITQPRWRHRVAVGAVLVVVFVLSAVPYLHHSGGASFSPYGGERYYASGGVPFGGSDSYGRVSSDETFSAGYIRSELFAEVPDKAASTIYYFVGRHTGLLPFMPLALFVIGASLVRARSADWLGLAVLAGVIGYIAFYVVLFPHNYNGGGQTLGNRYFVQVYPSVLVLATVMRLRVRVLAAGAVASAAIAAVFMGQHYREPTNAIAELDKTNPIQRLLPFESNQDGANYFRCGANVCPPPDGDD